MNQKIVFVTRSLNMGGTEQVILALCQEWLDLNIDCQIILLEDHCQFASLPANLKYIAISKQKPNNLIQKIKVYLNVRKWIHQIQPDIVIALPDEIGVYMALVCMFRTFSLFVSERNDPHIFPKSRFARLFRSFAYRFVDGVIVQTPQVAQYFSKAIQKKCILLKNPLNLDHLPPYTKISQQHYFIAVGRLEPQKNYPLLIKAFAQYHQSNPLTKLYIYGDGSRRSFLKSLVEQNHLQDVIIFMGIDSDVWQKAKASCGYILCSDYEGLPNTMIEAIAMGIPVIGTNVQSGGVKYLLDTYQTGILIPVNDIDALVNAIKQLHHIDHTHCAKQAIKIRHDHMAKLVAKQWLDAIIK